MKLLYRPELVAEAGVYFDVVVAKIQAGDFRVLTPPERKICKECDLRNICASEGLFPAFEPEPLLVRG